MLQVSQTQKRGELRVLDVPRPSLRPGGVLVRTAYSLISAGTERSSVEVAKKSLIGKARARPEQVRQVMDAVRKQGLADTYRRVSNRLEQQTPLGYSSAGIVVAVGTGAEEFKVGDRVACAGAGYATHAEYNFVPRNLCVHAGNTPLDDASFGTLGAIALQGVRQADNRVGETVAVIGLGILGLITLQILKAAGCRVVGVDPNAERCALARSLGCDATASPGSEARTRVMEVSGGYGADSVIITAATSSSAPIRLAAELSRDRGCVVMVGATGMDVPRPLFFEKELDFKLSRSYGPGRYDPAYEEGGHDYPIGYVRWTEGRNISAFVELVASGKVQVKPLVTHTFPIASAADAYNLITQNKEPYLAVLLDYGLDLSAQDTDKLVAEARRPTATQVAAAPAVRANGKLGIGLIGAGNFATDTLLPALKADPHVQLLGVATATGLTARGAAERQGFGYACSDAAEVFADENVDAVVVATRHDTHAELVLEALAVGKPVFVEKPLALDDEELKRITDAAAGQDDPKVMVGFNRRFAPGIVAIRDFFRGTTEPLAFSYRVNAGYLPPKHWLHDPKVGGGRIIGEGCHFVDLLMFLAGAPPVEVIARALPDAGRYRQDNVAIQIRFENGALGTLHYLANGDARIGKERLEVSGGGACAILDDFKQVTLARDGDVKTIGKSWTKQDKGHRAEMLAFLSAVRMGGAMPIPLAQSAIVTATTFRIMDALRTGEPTPVAL